MARSVGEAMDADSQTNTGTEAPARELVMLGSRFGIDLGAPRALFDSAGARAFAAQDLLAGERIIALVSNTFAVRREPILDCLADPDAAIAGLPSVRGRGRPTFPDGSRPWVFFIDQPGEAAIGPRMGEKAAPLADSVIRKVVLPGILPSLVKLWRNEFTHRRLRPDTIFWADAARSKVLLGECFSESAGLGQHPVFETIERAMAIPEGRGEGGPPEDMFALGVTILALSLGYVPGLDRDPAELLRDRMALGSYQALTEGLKVEPGLINPIRSLMRDEADLRWTVDDLLRWMDGSSSPSRSGQTVKSFISAFTFDGTVMADRRALAVAFAAKPTDAAAVMRSEAFRAWLVSGFNDPEESVEILKIIDGTVGRRSLGTDIVVLSRIVGRLDPTAPIRIGGLVFAHDGFAPLLAKTLAEGQREHMRLLDDAISAGLILEAAARHAREGASERSMRIANQAEDILSRRSSGWGLERCVYTLVPGFPCLSPALVPGSVMTLADVLPGLNTGLEMQRGSVLPLDRHVVAFALAQDIDPRLAMSFGTAGEEAGLPALRFLAEIQARAGGAPCKSLAAELANALKPQVNAIRGRTRRRKLLEALERLSRAGDLVAMVRGLDLLREAQRDLDGFRAARRQYAANQQEIGQLSQGVRPDREDVRLAGERVAMVIAMVPLALVLLSIVMRMVP